MWGRVIEINTAVWLAMSPYIFAAQGRPGAVLFDTTAALVVGVLAGLSYWRTTRHAHLLLVVLAPAIAIYGRLAEASPSPWNQNHIVVGLFLLMIAVIPNEASLPPEAWREAT
ncbi:hypothetical protein [Lignipirellula cremea]|uniref:SPW repeat protein n=1 Tax=Lignipirellula cremea TaxID=2528010 RepID=A0A518DTB7_9BACT|nr:hypothetical protein [Lignipirellula cremea]QDU95063.1 hypothetical protein Pla8534_28750 [Lignipirellula cremea]